VKDSLWSVDLFRCESILLRSHWVMVVMDVFTRRIIGFGVDRADLCGSSVCRMFNQIITGEAAFPRHLSSDHDPLFRFHRWRANLRILEVQEIKSIPHLPMSHPFVERLIGTVRRVITCSSGTRSTWSESWKSSEFITTRAEQPGVSAAAVCRRRNIATGMIFRWRAQFGVRQREQAELGAVRVSHGEHGGEPATAVETLDLQNLLPVPDGMEAVELADGRKVFAPIGSNPDAVRKRVAERDLMLIAPAGVKIHLALGRTDMRKGFDSLAVLVQEVLKKWEYPRRWSTATAKENQSLRQTFFRGIGSGRSTLVRIVLSPIFGGGFGAAYRGHHGSFMGHARVALDRVGPEQIYGTIEAWRNRPIEGEHPYPYLDGIVLKRSWAGEIRNVSLLVAIGVNGHGYREILERFSPLALNRRANWAGQCRLLTVKRKSFAPAVMPAMSLGCPADAPPRSSRSSAIGLTAAGERVAYRRRTNGQVAQPSANGSVNGIADSRGNDGRARLAEADRHLRTDCRCESRRCRPSRTRAH
jgi:hypothetical protein